jgi:hypothetical protein
MHSLKTGSGINHYNIDILLEIFYNIRMSFAVKQWKILAT